MQVFQEPRSRRPSGRRTTRDVAMLLERLLDPNVPKMEEGPQLVKALNVLMLKLLEHCPRTNSFRALLELSPTRRSPSRTTPPRWSSSRPRGQVPDQAHQILGPEPVRGEPAAARRAAFFHSLGVDEIRRRGQCDDKPLRMVKTILHEVCKLVGDVWDAQFVSQFKPSANRVRVWS